MQCFRSLWVVLAVIFISGCNNEIKDFDLTQYETAKVIGTYNLGKAKEAIVIKTSAGVDATVLLASSVSIKFQDEKNERKIWPHTDYIYPAEIRQLGEKDLLFAKVSGFRLGLSEWQKEEKIFVYDLSIRKLIGWVKTN